MSEKGDNITHFWLYNRLAGQNLYYVKKIEKNPEKVVFWKKLFDDTKICLIRIDVTQSR